MTLKEFIEQINKAVEVDPSILNLQVAFEEEGYGSTYTRELNEVWLKNKLKYTNPTGKSYNYRYEWHQENPTHIYLELFSNSKDGLI